MFSRRYKIIFLLFLLSGFCGLLYQLVWIRMAYASFGVITPVLSVVVSVFMLGLSLGTWLGGKWIDKLRERLNISAIILYAMSEFLIGVSAFAVPKLFSLGERYLLFAGEMDSFDYLLLSALTIGISTLPWCIFMGFTFPFMMAFVKELNEANTTTFSYLYFANVIGAMCGTLLTAVVLIELLGFSHTLLVAAVLNFAVAITSILLSNSHQYRNEFAEDTHVGVSQVAKTAVVSTKEANLLCTILFATGFISMSMEIVWIRSFTPVLKTRTYSFSSLLTVYLLATWIGSWLYRRHLNEEKVLSTEKLLACISVFSLLPIVMNDPRLGSGILSALISIFPICASLGYLTPKLIDRYSHGHPFGAGKAYAYNIVGCILGPLFASYVFLPLLGVKSSLVILSAPFLLFILVYYRKTVFTRDWSIVMSVLALFLFFRASLINVSYEDLYASYTDSEVRRDHTATVISIGDGMHKRLLVNGIGITRLTPITKVMAHLPLAFLQNKPVSSLVICFGMGTTYRSLLSWNIEATAVELVPSVVDAFAYYFDDADLILNNPMGKIVIDDGRRFLMRTSETFDVITIDPPPPVEAAGSSLLYSEEFYDLVKLHLNEGGILQQWFPYGELKILQAVARSLSNSFPYVKVYKSLEGWGFHFIASMTPVQVPSVNTITDRMPKTAGDDLMEWYDIKDLTQLMTKVLAGEMTLEEILTNDKTLFITDDRPYNEYYILRRYWDKMRGVYRFVS